MNNFKIVIPVGYKSTNINNDNIDVNIIFEFGDVFYGSIITPQNIEFLMNKEQSSYFWMSDMLIVKNLKKETIKEAIRNVIQDGIFDNIFSKIGDITSIYGNKNYSDLIDMNDLAKS